MKKVVLLFVSMLIVSGSDCLALCLDVIDVSCSAYGTADVPAGWYYDTTPPDFESSYEEVENGVYEGSYGDGSFTFASDFTNPEDQIGIMTCASVFTREDSSGIGMNFMRDLEVNLSDGLNVAGSTQFEIQFDFGFSGYDGMIQGGIFESECDYSNFTFTDLTTGVVVSVNRDDPQVPYVELDTTHTYRIEMEETIDFPSLYNINWIDPSLPQDDEAIAMLAINFANPVPEPATLSLLALGGLALRRRKK